jgi:hypothetical protein
LFASTGCIAALTSALGFATFARAERVFSFSSEIFAAPDPSTLAGDFMGLVGVLVRTSGAALCFLFSNILAFSFTDILLTGEAACWDGAGTCIGLAGDADADDVDEDEDDEDDAAAAPPPPRISTWLVSLIPLLGAEEGARPFWAEFGTLLAFVIDCPDGTPYFSLTFAIRLRSFPLYLAKRDSTLLSLCGQYFA